MNITGLFINGTIVCFLILAILYIILDDNLDNKEGFVSYGIHPISSNKPLLENNYPLKIPGVLSNSEYKEQLELFPAWAVGSYKQKTNNIKNLEHPCNELNIPSRNCRRVNCYSS